MPDIYINTERPADRSIVAGINQPQKEALAGEFVAGSDYTFNLFFVRNDGSYDTNASDDIEFCISNISNTRDGNFTLTDGQDTTIELAYGCSALEIETALNNLNNNTGLNLGVSSLVDVEKLTDSEYKIHFRNKGEMSSLNGSSVTLFPESSVNGVIGIAGSSTTYAQQMIQVVRQPAIYENVWSISGNGYNSNVTLNTTRLLQSLVLEPELPFYLEVKLKGAVVAREIVSIQQSTMPASVFSEIPIKSLLDLFAADPDNNTNFNATNWASALSVALGAVTSVNGTTGDVLVATVAQGTLADSALQSSDIDTLAELNAIITDATLIDTTDSRLSDARTPTPHTHTASQVTDFDAEVSNNTDVAANTADRHDAASIAASGGRDYVTISGTQQLTLHPVDLTADVSGDLPVADGGTGASDAATARTNLGVDAAGTDNSTATLGFACSDETSALAVGQAIAIDMPHDMTVTTVYASLATAGATSSITVDVEDEGTSILSSVLTLTAGSENTETSTFTGAASSYALSKGDKLTIDIDSIDDGTGAGLKVVLLGSI